MSSLDLSHDLLSLLFVDLPQLYPGSVVLRPALNNPDYDVRVCAYDNIIPFITIVGVPNGIAMLACAFLAFKVRCAVAVVACFSILRSLYTRGRRMNFICLSFTRSGAEHYVQLQ